jgi:hypothetical protein
MSPKAPRTLPVDFPELCLALSAEADDLRWYLDLQTGDVLLLNREWDPAEHGGLTADEIEADEARFRLVPPPEPKLSVDDMSAYAKQVSDPVLKDSLELALSAPKPERRFRAVLGWLPEEQEKWHRFREARCQARAKAWLDSLGLARAPRAPDTESAA